ncbi:hypothetical protein JHK87_027540 [Glycine soja]|nr:hypothetical protein JHK87_027540 [Glycine soja]
MPLSSSQCLLPSFLGSREDASTIGTKPTLVGSNPAQESLFWLAEASSSTQTGPTPSSYPSSILGAYGAATAAPSTSVGTSTTPPMTATVLLLQRHRRKPTSDPGGVDPGQ